MYTTPVEILRPLHDEEAAEERQSVAVEPDGYAGASGPALVSVAGHPASQPPPGVYFCQVKGATRRHGGDPLGAAGGKLFAVGEPVQLAPDPRNKLDPEALLVRRLSGEPIGFVTGRQAARFVDRLHLMTVTVHSWDKDEWDHDVLNLRVAEMDAPEDFHPATAPAPAAHAVPLTPIQTLFQAALHLSLPKVLLGSLLITCTGVAIVTHSWKPAAIAAVAVLLMIVLRSAKS